MTLPILFEDGEALVIDKPAGLPLDMPRAGGVSLENHLDRCASALPARPPPSTGWTATPPAACC
jgi:tRNA pseudouridine32 synthase/23S rRNA pseudouridine746 synthase